jgi:hypothetical protein
MNFTKRFSLVAAFALASFGVAAPVSAQATRTWVSGVGDDVNPCSRTAPCKTFAGSISKTAAGGEINVLDPGGYGAITITKSIVIDGKGQMASILAFGTNGVIINGAGIVVTLRNLTINGANSTTGNGIRIINAAAVNIENVTIENFAGTGAHGRGITIETGSNVQVTVRNSHLVNHNNTGIHSNPTAGVVTLTVDGSSVSQGGFHGIHLQNATHAFINETSVTGHNRTIGAALCSDLATTNAYVSNSFFAHNAYGVMNGTTGASRTWIFNTVITGNAVDGLKIISGTVASYGNNGIRANAGNQTPSGTSMGTQ